MDNTNNATILANDLISTQPIKPKPVLSILHKIIIFIIPIIIGVLLYYSGYDIYGIMITPLIMMAYIFYLSKLWENKELSTNSPVHSTPLIIMAILWVVSIFLVCAYPIETITENIGLTLVIYFVWILIASFLNIRIISDCLKNNCKISNMLIKSNIVIILMIALYLVSLTQSFLMIPPRII
jgi:hypothetical protein